MKVQSVITDDVDGITSDADLLRVWFDAYHSNGQQQEQQPLSRSGDGDTQQQGTTARTHAFGQMKSSSSMSTAGQKSFARLRSRSGRNSQYFGSSVNWKNATTPHHHHRSAPGGGARASVISFETQTRPTSLRPNASPRAASISSPASLQASLLLRSGSVVEEDHGVKKLPTANSASHAATLRVRDAVTKARREKQEEQAWLDAQIEHRRAVEDANRLHRIRASSAASRTVKATSDVTQQMWVPAAITLGRSDVAPLPMETTRM